MGNCCTTKLMPIDFHNSTELVKAVLPVPLKNEKNKIENNFLQSNSQKQQRSNNKSKNRPESSKSIEEKMDSKPSHIVSHYRAKFDIRVTSKYDIKALIGCGNFSRVVRVENRVTKVPYAIKIVDRINGKEVCESELNVLKRVQHMYIVQLREIFETRDKVYIVMELATGGELFDRIMAKGSFTEMDAVGVLKMVLEGLGYLHSLGITHRDLKPENLLYYHPGPDSKILITDFGLSAVRKSSDGTMHTICGTSEYIAPEILARKPYTSQVDMWAVGVITYILLSGTMPFDEDSNPRLYKKIIRAEYNFEGKPWKDVSSLAKNFITRLLVADVNARMTAIQALTHSWIRTCSTSKNLYRTISKNLLDRQSTHNSGKSSSRSQHSNRSNKSARSDNRRVVIEDIEELHRDPVLRAELSSSSEYHS